MTTSSPLERTLKHMKNALEQEAKKAHRFMIEERIRKMTLTEQVGRIVAAASENGRPAGILSIHVQPMIGDDGQDTGKLRYFISLTSKEGRSAVLSPRLHRTVEEAIIRYAADLTLAIESQLEDLEELKPPLQKRLDMMTPPEEK
jgi:hypothetical protein